MMVQSDILRISYSGSAAIAAARLTLATFLSYLMMLEESKKNDDRNWNS